MYSCIPTYISLSIYMCVCDPYHVCVFIAECYVLYSDLVCCALVWLGLVWLLGLLCFVVFVLCVCVALFVCVCVVFVLFVLLCCVACFV